jgi:hypothetical protein
MAFAGETPPSPTPPAALNGSAPSPYNATAWAQLAAASSGQQIEALLLEYAPEGQAEKLAWGFLINPASMQFENSASYGEVAPHATTVVSSQYSHTTGDTFTTPGMRFSTWCCGKSVRPLLEGLKSLLEADPLNGKFAPPLLRFSWGSFDLGPLSLISYSYTVTAVLGGEPADVRDMTLTFKEQPRPLTQAEQEALAQARLEQQMADRAAQNGPKMPLTERQGEEAKERAKLYLEKNKDQFSADAQALIQGGGYSLEVDQNTGLVTMLDTEGKKLGVVSQYDATNHKVGANLTTVPLKEGAKLSDGAIGEDGAVAPPAAATPAPSPSPMPDVSM